MPLVTVEEALEWMGDPSLERAQSMVDAEIARQTVWLEGELGLGLDGESSRVSVFGLQVRSKWLYLRGEIVGPEPFVAADPLVEYRLGISQAYTAADAVEDLEFETVNDSRGVYTLVSWQDGRYWPTGPQTVRVTRQTGYALNTAPEDLRGLVLDLVAVAIRDRARVVSAPVDASGAVVYRSSKLSPTSVSTLDRWRLGTNPAPAFLALA